MSAIASGLNQSRKEDFIDIDINSENEESSTSVFNQSINSDCSYRSDENERTKPPTPTKINQKFKFSLLRKSNNKETIFAESPTKLAQENIKNLIKLSADDEDEDVDDEDADNESDDSSVINTSLKVPEREQLKENLNLTIKNSISNEFLKLASSNLTSTPQVKTANYDFEKIRCARNSFSDSLNSSKCDSIIDTLLGQIYDRFNGSLRDNFDSDFNTEVSISSSRFSDFDHEFDVNLKSQCHLTKTYLKEKSLNELRDLVAELSSKVNQISAKLIRNLKCKDKLLMKQDRNCDIITAFLQATSLKRRIDAQMKFSINPLPGENGFIQWQESVKALTRLPGGIPQHFRKTIWLNLAHNYIKEINLDWPKTCKFVFNDRSNPDDDELGIQIVKDLHRTGCSSFSGDNNEKDRAMLKRVLLAFARFNKSIGYCQGFNIIAAFLLEIVDKKEEDALALMIYIIDAIIPSGYFTNSLQSLAIDMAVFREIMKQKLPKLYNHLNVLQNGSNAPVTTKNKKASLNQNNYEPPLTNVFTMQWFLTIFATCLPKNIVYRVWDGLLAESSTEILFRCSLAIWDKLSQFIMKASNADHFYTLMSSLTLKLLDEDLFDENELVNKIYSFGPMPISELREKYTFSITPFQMNLQNGSQKNAKKASTAVVGAGANKNGSIFSKVQNLGASLKGKDPKALNQNSQLKMLMQQNPDEDLAKMISCFALLVPQLKGNELTACANSANSPSDISEITPGAYSYTPQNHNPKSIEEQLTLDISELKKQYNKLKQRQQQAHVIIEAATAKHRLKNLLESKKSSDNEQFLLEIDEESPVCNHLLIKPENSNKNTLNQAISLHYASETVVASPFAKINVRKKDINSWMEIGSPNSVKKTHMSRQESLRNESSGEDDDVFTRFANSNVKLSDLTLNELTNLKLEVNNNQKAKADENLKNELDNDIRKFKESLSDSKVEKKSVANSKNTSAYLNSIIANSAKPVIMPNPFPQRRMNSMVAKNGMRLGLYK